MNKANPIKIKNTKLLLISLIFTLLLITYCSLISTVNPLETENFYTQSETKLLAEPGQYTIYYYIGTVPEPFASLPAGINGLTYNVQVPKANYPSLATRFLGWYTDPGASGSLFDFTQTLDNDQNVYAHFEMQYLIQFKNAPDGTGDENVIDSRTVSPGQPIWRTEKESTLTNPAYPNAHIDYWYIEGGDDAVEFIFGSYTTSDLTLVPHWSDSYWVYFKSGGAVVEPKIVNHEKAVEKPDNPIRNGYIFCYWLYPQAMCPYDFSTPVTADITLEAVWEPRTDVPYSIVVWLERPDFSGKPTPGHFADYNYVTTIHLTNGTAGIPTPYTDLSSLPTIVQNMFNDSPLKYAVFQEVQNKEIRGSGSTIINVFAERKIYTYDFKFPSGNTGWYMTINDDPKRYGNGVTNSVYEIDFKYEQNVATLWPSGDGVIFVLSDPYHYLQWGTASEMNQIVENTNLMSKRTVIDSSLLPASGSNTTVLTFTMETTTSQLVDFRYFIEVLSDETPTAPTISRTFGGVTRNYVEMVEYRQLMNDGTYAKRINGLDPMNDGAPARFSLANDRYTEASLNGPIRIFFYNRHSGLIFDFDSCLPENAMGDVSNMPAKKEFVYGQSVGIAEPSSDPVLGGYTFEGWYKDPDYMELFNFKSKMLYGNVTVFANWRANDLTVTFYDEIGSTVKIGDIGIGQGDYLDFISDVPSGYQQGWSIDGKGVFDAWYTLSNSKWVTWSEEFPVESDLDLYAGYRVNGFKLTYDIGDKQISVPIQDEDSYWFGQYARLNYGTDIDLSESGEVLVGWTATYLGSGGDDSTIYYPGYIYSVKGDTMLTAVYADLSSLVEVIYHSNYPDGLTDDKPFSRFLIKDSAQTTFTLEGNNLFFKSADDLSFKGVVLVGWKLHPDRTTVDYNLGAQIPTPTDELNLYGHWQDDGYSIFFVASNNGVLTDSDNSGVYYISYNGIISGTLWKDAVSRGVPTPVANSGFKFKEWRVGPVSGPRIELPPTGNPAVLTHLSYVAVFAPTYTVTYKDGDSIFMVDSEVYIAGETVTILSTKPAKDDSVFTGWLASHNDEIYLTGFTMPAENVILTAQWVQDVYTVVYAPGDHGTWMAADETTTGLLYGVVTPGFGKSGVDAGVDCDDGWLFAGWSPLASALVSANVTYVAQWVEWIDEPVLLWSVTYQLGGHGSFSGYPDSTVEIQYSNIPDGAVRPVAPAVLGEAMWEFIGWSPVLKPTVTGNIVYVAQWCDLAVPYTVRYLLQGSTTSLANDKVGSGYIGATATENAINITGYKVVGNGVLSAVLNATDNVFPFYYTKNPVSDPAPTPSSPTPSSPAPIVTKKPSTPTPPATTKPSSDPHLLPTESPVALPLGSVPIWALLNLILSIIGVILAIIVTIGIILQRNQEQQQNYEQKKPVKGQSRALKQNLYEKDNKESAVEVKKQKQRRLFWFFLSVILGIAGIIVFILTEDITRKVALVDRWTIVNLIIFVVEIITILLIFKRKKSKDEIVAYTVHYCLQGTKNSVAPSKTSGSGNINFSITEHAANIAGYTVVGDGVVSLTLNTDANRNVITFYYTVNTAEENKIQYQKRRVFTIER